MAHGGGYELTLEDVGAMMGDEMPSANAVIVSTDAWNVAEFNEKVIYRVITSCTRHLPSPSM